MSAIVYLNFDGVAEQAIDFYSKALNAKEVKKVKFKDFPQDPNYPLPENELNMIMESSVEFAGGKIMISDILPSMTAVMGELVKGNNVLISLVNDDKPTLEEYFNHLSVGGHVVMPLSNTPWSSCFGMLVDQFGVSWKFNSDADQFLDNVISNKQ
ncbi:MAG: VOC family protein [Paenibacillus macerans]|uniref:3-demethylubiquinone-9 3-methyltransferase family protein n=1 Tax=Paenibacillus macerans TaxID=44252 RepID=A0A090ZJF1_PAEMA|nr:VOC family protein [Paenibacillus macerans]KFN10390.1 3-demethylubiquinone-9 3-methyltransferase family protein [Paenibacillus macerans]MBS5910425.1 VOC family protein [Paenibacillus macerans]MCY7557031.1 VOC family protein [Paenibacillus macerans]MDU5945617.1 VOC family protein [Paenibacillus macerans]MDU7472990.1 VOC family protein [Paenibacillus macerans]